MLQLDFGGLNPAGVSSDKTLFLSDASAVDSFSGTETKGQVLT